MRLIDADALKRHKQLEAFGNGQYEDVEIVYGNDIDNAPTIDNKTINAYHAGYEQGRFDEAVSSVIPVKCYECVFLDGCPVRQYLTDTHAGFCSDGERRKGGARWNDTILK